MSAGIAARANNSKLFFLPTGFLRLRIRFCSSLIVYVTPPVTPRQKGDVTYLGARPGFETRTSKDILLMRVLNLTQP